MHFREKEPWEASDGALFLLREISEVAPKVRKAAVTTARESQSWAFVCWFLIIRRDLFLFRKLLRIFQPLPSLPPSDTLPTLLPFTRRCGNLFQRFVVP